VAETIIQITVNGQAIHGSDVPIVQSDERWSEYKLEDGTTLRVKLAVGSIVRLADQYDPEGNPVYLVKGSAISVPIVPEGKQKKD
jgi:hypothetical protein